MVAAAPPLHVNAVCPSLVVEASHQVAVAPSLLAAVAPSLLAAVPPSFSAVLLRVASVDHQWQH